MNDTITDLQFAFKRSNDAMAEGVKITSGPKPEDWDRLRPIMSRLYFDQAMSLKDVAAIMRQKYDHKASDIMYKKRFRKWGIEKYRKRQITSRGKERTSAKRTLPLQTKQWQLEDERLDLEIGRNVLQSYQTAATGDSHCKANEVSNLSIPIRMAYDKPLEDEGDYTGNSGEVNTTGRHSSDLRTAQTRKAYVDRCKISYATLGPIVSRRQQLSPPNNAKSRCSPWDIPWVIAPPQSLLVPERFLFSVKNFTQTSLDRFRAKGEGSLNRHKLGITQKTDPGVWSRFSDNCIAALFFLRQNSFVEARQMMSRACEMCKDVIEEGHPETLTGLFSMYLSYHKAGFVACAVEILENLRCVAMMIQKTSCNFNQAIHDMLLLDHNAQGAYFAAWDCCEDAFAQCLQPFHQARFNSRLVHIGTVGLCGNWEKAERLSRSLLTDCEQLCGKTDPRYFRNQRLIPFSLFQQRKFKEAEKATQDHLRCIERLENQEQHAALNTRALHLLSNSQYQQSKYDVAEKNLKRCIGMNVEKYGENDVRTIRYSQRLETWLEQWGRHNEAAALAAQRNRILGSPIIEELLE